MNKQIFWINNNTQYSQKNYCTIVREVDENTLKTLEESAEKGDLTSLKRLGQIYEKGLGVEKNYEKSISYYNRASNQGDGFSMGRLGYIYERKLFVINENEALEKGIEEDLSKLIFESQEELINKYGSDNFSKSFLRINF